MKIRVKISKSFPKKYLVQYKYLFWWFTIDWFLSEHTAIELYDKIRKRELSVKGVIKQCDTSDYRKPNPPPPKQIFAK